MAAAGRPGLPAGPAHLRRLQPVGRSRWWRGRAPGQGRPESSGWPAAAGPGPGPCCPPRSPGRTSRSSRWPGRATPWRRCWPWAAGRPTRLLGAWSNQDGTSWTLSRPYQPGAARPLSACGVGRTARWGVLLSGGRAVSVSGPGAAWRSLPALPAGASSATGRRGHPGGGPGRLRGPDGPGRPAVRLGPVLRWFRVGPVPGHQRGHSLRLVLVRMVHCELPHRPLVLRPVPDRGGGPGGLARDRAGPAGPAVPAGADPPAEAPLALVLRRSRRPAPRGRITHRLLGRRLLLRAHAPAPAAHVRRAHAGRGRGALAAAARWAARPDGPDRDRRGAAGPLVTPAPRHRGLPAAALGLGDPVLRRDAGLAHSRAVRSRGSAIRPCTSG